MRPPSCTAVMAVPLPEASVAGAATTTSQPASAAAAASCQSPSLSMPSSLVTTTRGRSGSVTGRDLTEPAPEPGEAVVPPGHARPRIVGPVQPPRYGPEGEGAGLQGGV